MSKLLKYIDLALLGFSTILFVCIIWIGLHALILDGWGVSITMGGVKGMQRFWLEYKPLVVAFGYTLTLFIASHNLAKYIDAETVNALARLREMLNSPEKKIIHNYLLDEDDKNLIIPEIDKTTNDDCCEFSNVEIFDYLGIIELGVIMRERGVITSKEFESQFGYRVENIWRNREIVRHIMANKEYYEHLLKTR